MSLRLNIVLKPPQDVAQKAIDLSHEIGRNKDALFVLNGAEFYPHITIYASEFSEENLDKVLRELESISSDSSAVTLRFTGTYSAQGFVGLNFESSSANDLHHEVLRRVSPLRVMNGGSREFLGYHIDFNPAQLKNIADYGYPDAMKLYAPHLTLARLRERGEVPNIEWDIPEFKVDKIAVYLMGDNGTCRELVKEFDIKMV